MIPNTRGLSCSRTPTVTAEGRGGKVFKIDTKPSYFCLDHPGPLEPQIPGCMEDIHHSLCLEPLNEDTHCYVGPCPATPSTGVCKCVCKYALMCVVCELEKLAHLQCTTTGLSPELCCHFWTCPMRSMSPDPEGGTDSSGQSVYWNCFTFREELS